MIPLFLLSVAASVSAMVLYDKLKGSQARAIEDNRGGGGPANFGAYPVNTLRIDTPDMQPSWHTPDNMYLYETATPNRAGVPANNFRENGDLYGARQ